MRTTLAVIAGFIVWTVLWLGTNAALRGGGMLPSVPTEAIAAATPLLALLVASVICDLASGYVAARVAHAYSAVTILGIILLLVGIAVQVQYWKLTPAWYSIAFLVLILPLTIAGGRMYRPATLARATIVGT